MHRAVARASINSSIREHNSIAANVSHARTFARVNFSKCRYVQWFADELRFVRDVTHKPVPLAVTPQHRAPQHEPQNRSRSLRALRTPVVTASRQARDNEIQYIFSTSTKTPSNKDNNIHREIGAHIRRKIKYICTNNVWPSTKLIIDNTLGPAKVRTPQLNNNHTHRIVNQSTSTLLLTIITTTTTTTTTITTTTTSKQQSSDREDSR